MDALLRALPPAERVLDLAAQRGSFDPHRYPDLRLVRVDLDPAPVEPGAVAVQADAAALPFADQTFGVVICNHGLEHFAAVQQAVAEMGRVVHDGGGLFLAVPDAGTLTDRLYRFLAKGGGHVNAFRSAGDVERLVENRTKLRCIATWTLFTSLSFLHPANRGSRRNHRLWILLGGGERMLRWTTWILRNADRVFGTRLAVYGWAFHFGRAPGGAVHCWTNVCVRCGSGHPADRLRADLGGWPPAYRCPRCGTRNFFTDDEV